MNSLRIDLERYILQLADQSIKMKEEVDKVNKVAKEQNLPEETVRFLNEQANLVETNYQRVLYCKYLLDLKPKFIRDFIDRQHKKKLQKFIEKKADKDSVIEENKEALDKVKEISNG